LFTARAGTYAVKGVGRAAQALGRWQGHTSANRLGFLGSRCGGRRSGWRSVGGGCRRRSAAAAAAAARSGCADSAAPNDLLGVCTSLVREKQLQAVKLIGANLQIQPMSKLDEMKFNGSLKEICNAKKNQ
jgi:hypothetical protein